MSSQRAPGLTLETAASGCRRAAESWPHSAVTWGCDHPWKHCWHWAGWEKDTSRRRAPVQGEGLWSTAPYSPRPSPPQSFLIAPLPTVPVPHTLPTVTFPSTPAPSLSSCYHRPAADAHSLHFSSNVLMVFVLLVLLLGKSSP